jgi:hypothetical protein
MMAKKKKSKERAFTFEEFKKEFYTKDNVKRPRRKNRFYELGVRMARESLAGS